MTRSPASPLRPPAPALPAEGGLQDVRKLPVGRRVNRRMGRAICHYGLIDDGDRIAVGLSGGKDSLGLLWLLAERRRRVPVNYDLVAVHIDLGFGQDTEPLVSFCEGLGVECVVVPTDIGPEAHKPGNPESPCFHCSRMRRNRLFQTAQELGCRKLALGHHRDDIIQTFFLNVLYSSEISTMVPSQGLFGGRLTIIRPLALCDESMLARLAGELSLPVIPSACPSAGRSARHQIAQWLAPIFRHNRKVRGNVFRALSNVKLDYLPPR